MLTVWPSHGTPEAFSRVTAIELAGPVTALDRDAGGTRAVAVMRDAGLVAVLELPAALTDPAAIVTATPPVCLYWNCQLKNYVRESLDYLYHPTTVN